MKRKFHDHLKKILFAQKNYQISTIFFHFICTFKLQTHAKLFKNKIGRCKYKLRTFYIFHVVH